VADFMRGDCIKIYLPRSDPIGGIKVEGEVRIEGNL